MSAINALIGTMVGLGTALADDPQREKREQYRLEHYGMTYEQCIEIDKAACAADLGKEKCGVLDFMRNKGRWDACPIPDDL
jgi:hypothetical protein